MDRPRSPRPRPRLHDIDSPETRAGNGNARTGRPRRHAHPPSAHAGYGARVDQARLRKLEQTQTQQAPPPTDRGRSTTKDGRARSRTRSVGQFLGRQMGLVRDARDSSRRPHSPDRQTQRSRSGSPVRSYSPSPERPRPNGLRAAAQFKTFASRLKSLRQDRHEQDEQDSRHDHPVDQRAPSLYDRSVSPLSDSDELPDTHASPYQPTPDTSTGPRRVEKRLPSPPSPPPPSPPPPRRPSRDPAGNEPAPYTANGNGPSGGYLAGLFRRTSRRSKPQATRYPPKAAHTRTQSAVPFPSFVENRRASVTRQSRNSIPLPPPPVGSFQPSDVQNVSFPASDVQNVSFPAIDVPNVTRPSQHDHPPNTYTHDAATIADQARTIDRLRALNRAHAARELEASSADRATQDLPDSVVRDRWRALRYMVHQLAAEALTGRDGLGAKQPAQRALLRTLAKDAAALQRTRTGSEWLVEAAVWAVLATRVFGDERRPSPMAWAPAPWSALVAAHNHAMHVPGHAHARAYHAWRAQTASLVQTLVAAEHGPDAPTTDAALAVVAALEADLCTVLGRSTLPGPLSTRLAEIADVAVALDADLARQRAAWYVHVPRCSDGARFGMPLDPGCMEPAEHETIVFAGATMGTTVSLVVQPALFKLGNARGEGYDAEPEAVSPCFVCRSPCQ